MQKRFKTYEDERELKAIEKLLAKEFGLPYVSCGYDSYCSHKYYDKDELDNRRKDEILKLNEYAINYELHKTKDSYDANQGGYDGEVYELVYSTDKGKYITLKYCSHMVFDN